MSEGRARFLDHGVDIELFRRRTAPEPPDQRSIPHPRLGFFGGIDDYVVDLDLLEYLARSMPDATSVLIGDATCSMDSIRPPFRMSTGWVSGRTSRFQPTGVGLRPALDAMAA